MQKNLKNNANTIHREIMYQLKVWEKKHTYKSGVAGNIATLMWKSPMISITNLFQLDLCRTTTCVGFLIYKFIVPVCRMAVVK